MPLCFKTAIKESPVGGRGVFAQEDIPEGSIYWTYEDQGNSIAPLNYPNYNSESILYSEEDLKKLTDDEIRKVIHCGFFYGPIDQYLQLRDGTGVMNHSNNPNSLTIFDKDHDPKKMKSIALRLIKAGEQLTENYNNYHPRDSKTSWFIELSQKYLPQDVDFFDSIAPQNAPYLKKN